MLFLGSAVAVAKAGNAGAELSMSFPMIVPLMCLSNSSCEGKKVLFFWSHSSFIAIHITSKQSEEEDYFK